MKKEDRVSPNILEDNWQKIRPQLTKQIMDENPDKPLEVMRVMKQIDEVNHQMTELLTGTFAAIDHMEEMRAFHEAAKKSALLQEQKYQKSSAQLEIVPNTKES